MEYRLLRLLPLLIAATANGQFSLTYDPSVPVDTNGSPYTMAWAGGVNFSQWSNLDVNADGLSDLFYFDRSGSEVTILINDGGPGGPNYHVSRDYDDVYPFNELHDWVLLRDYNCDDKPDIWSYSLGGARVYKNTSSGGNLSFQLVTNLVYTNYQPTPSNLYITQVDIPGIEDIDNDGDLDVITFSIFGSYLELHRNLSMELYNTCDSLTFQIRNRCFGYFSEDMSTNTVNLDDSCDYNVPNPEMPGLIDAITEYLERGLHDAGAPANEDEDGTPGATRSGAHVGSTILPIDLDGDTVKELLLGDVLFSNLTALFNDGTVHDNHMFSQDSLFPNYDVPVNLEIFPAAFYVKVDDDDDRDLIVGVNSTSLAHNYRSVLYYKNIGTDQIPLFQFQDVDLFQDRMIETGEGAYPVLFDHDGDGLMDILVSNYGYYLAGGNYLSEIALYRNTGSATQPAFTKLTDDYQGLSGSGIGQAMHPAFADLDNDGDKDMMIGDLQGKLHYYVNNPVGSTASFSLSIPILLNDTGAMIDVGQFAKPCFFDVDGDGVLDMIVGERNGNVNYYHNTGTLAAPAWHLDNDTLGGVVVKEWWNVTGYSVPLMFINDAGQRELLVGSESGWIWDFDNIDGNINGSFNLVDSTWQDVKEGSHSSVVLHDFDADGARDAITGNYRGGLGYWRNDFNVSTASGNGLSASDAFTLMPNPAAGSTTLLVSIPLSSSTEIIVLDATGRTVVHQPVRSRHHVIDTQRWSNGVYSVRLSDRGKSWTQRLVVLR